MKILGSHIFRSLCCLCVGLLLVVNSSVMGPLIVQIVGGLFLVSSTVALATWLFNKLFSNSGVRPTFPFLSIGSLCFGLLLVCFPAGFMAYMVSILGFILVMAGVQQVFSQISYRHVAPVSLFGFIVPVLLLGIGLYICFNPLESLATTLEILGAAIAIYGFSDLIMAIRFSRYHRIYAAKKREEERQAEIAREAQYVDFEIVDATKEE